MGNTSSNQNSESKPSWYKSLQNNFVSGFIGSLFAEEKPTYCCQECPSVEQYKWMDENVYGPMIAEGKLSQKMIERHRNHKPFPCKPSELTKCSECSRMLCPKCTENGLKWGKYYHPWKKEPFVKCDACCWNEVT